LSFTALATPAAPLIKNPKAPNIGKINNIPPRFAVGSTRLFVVLFFVFIFVFMPMHAIFVLAFIAVQTVVAATFSPQESNLSW